MKQAVDESAASLSPHTNTRTTHMQDNTHTHHLQSIFSDHRNVGYKRM